MLAFRRWGLGISLAAGLLAGAAGLALAQSLAPENRSESWVEAGPEVDVALVLAVDISYSMDHEELTLQREGYVNALTSTQVLDAIRKGAVGRIAVTYIEWAGVNTRHVIADWAIIDGPASAKAFAEELQAAPIRRARRTSVTGAIEFSMERLRDAKLRPLRRVIDISGDGPNNEGGSVTRARDRALAAGVVINGLPIILPRGYTSAYDLEGLDDYYEDCVIGGIGAFMEVITDRSQFSIAIRSKILREVAQATMNDATPGKGRPSRADCFIGEKQWRQNWERN